MNNQYLCFSILSFFFCANLFGLERDDLSRHYQSPDNAQGSLPIAGDSKGGPKVPSQFLPGSFRPAFDIVKVNGLVQEDARSNYVEAQIINPYIKRNKVSFSEESFAYILNSRPMNSPVTSFENFPNFKLGLSDDCPISSFSLLDSYSSKGIDFIEKTLDEMNSRSQYCGFEIEGIDPVSASVNFCQCVKQKTVNFGENEDVIYPVMRDNEVFAKAVKAFKQQFVDLVISEVFSDLDGMTNQANAFLSTEELSPFLFGKVEDTNNNMTVDFAETRRMVHGCSGVAMKDMISEMFTPDKNGVALCDAGSADTLLSAIKKYSSCGVESDSECDDLTSFAENEFYADESSEKIISDLMTFQFSKNLINTEALLERVPTDASSMDRYRMSLSLASSMSDFEGDNRILLKEKINMRPSLPADNHLVMIGELIKQADENKDFDLSAHPAETIKSLVRTLRLNPLLKEEGVSFREDEHEKNRVWIEGYVKSLINDRELRIREDENFSVYFGNTNPMEAARVLVINNYVQKSEDLGLRCEAVKDKVRKLCSSISGNGVALFSHPDFRKHAPEFITEANLHKEINGITASKREINPVVDQLFCHANFASLSNDCQEIMRIRSDAKVSFAHCAYDSTWLLKHLDSELISGAEGNVEDAVMKTNENVTKVAEERKNTSKSASSNAFVSMVGRDGEVYSGYGRDSPPRNTVRQLANNDFQKISRLNEYKNIPLSPAYSQVEESESNMKTGSSSRFSFSENFSTNSSVNVASASASPVVIPSFISPQAASKVETSTSGATEILLNELRASEESQKRYKGEIEQLRHLNKTKSQSLEKQELESKEQELSRLDERVRSLRAETQKKRGPNNEISARANPQASGFARPSATPTPSPSPQYQNISSAGASGGSNTGTSGANAGVQSSSARGGVNRTAASLASTTASGSIGLVGQGQQRVFPRESTLSQVARVLDGSNFFLRDIGIPGKAEKIVFKLVDGEVLYIDGEPQIAFVELVDLNEEKLAIEKPLVIEEMAIPSPVLLDQQRTSSRRLQWDEVIQMLEDHTIK